MYKISVIWRSTPQSFCKPPFCLGIPPLFLEPLGNPSFGVVRLPSTQIPGWLYTDLPPPLLPIRVQRFLKLKKSPASVARKSSVLILKNICNLLCVVLAPEL
jgi:hypothetical protein